MYILCWFEYKKSGKDKNVYVSEISLNIINIK
jgi:hypothetical protein